MKVRGHPTKLDFFSAHASWIGMTKTSPNPIPPGAGNPKTADPGGQSDRDRAVLELETNLKRKPSGKKNKTLERRLPVHRQFN